MNKTYIFKILVIILFVFACNKKEKIEKKSIQDSINENKNYIELGEDKSSINSYAKRIYKKDEKIYIELDFIEFHYPDKENIDESDREIINNNKKIRTYIIDKNTNITSKDCKNLNALELFQFRESLLKDKSIIVIGISKNGILTEINFGCYG